MTSEARAVLGLLLVAGLGVLPGSVQAQRDGPSADTPRLLIVTFRSPDAGLGTDAAEEVRKRVKDEVSSKKLLVIPQNAIEANLKASGFNPDSAPDPITAKLLAQALRADQYVSGTASKTPQGYRIDAQIVLASNANMVQPVPVAQSDKLGDAAKAVAKSIAAARQQLDNVLACERAIQAGQYDAALKAARAAVAAYAQSTNGRDCLAQAYSGLKYPPDSIIAVTSQVVKIDPQNKPALRLLAQAYQDAGNADQAAKSWTELLALDPKNVDLQTQVVKTLAQSGKTALATPIIQKAVSENPNNADLVKLQWLILYAGKDWKGAAAAGEKLAKMDTSAVDSTFFTRLAAAYASDSQPQKAAQVTSRAVAKFPNSATLWALNAQTLRLAGQTQQSIAAAQHAISLNPKSGKVRLTLAQGQMDLNQPDSAIATLRQALANGADSATVGQFLLVLGNKAYQHADTTKAMPDYQRAVQVLSMADSVAPSPTVKFLLGVSSFYLGDALTRANQQDKSCEEANQADSAFTLSQVNVMQGASVDTAAAGQVMSALQKYDPTVKSMIKVFCKKKK
ncbi:MAG TPA: tetratricopeptide repeat protein [Gemmatimonadaceae bacterium]|nr:tetratricopeptide repeat protein [Gemmatimonadaceae bacterium]